MLSCDTGLERLYCGEWKEGYYFNENEVVEYNGGFYRSLVNENNSIPSDEQCWIEIINKNRIDDRYELKNDSIVKDADYVHTDNNYTNLEKNKLANLDLTDINAAIQNITTMLASDDTTLDEIQEIVNFIKQNKEIFDTLSISNIAGLSDALYSKQETLESTVNIATINGQDLLMGGDIIITAEGGIPIVQKGTPNGVAELNEDGTVPIAQLPTMDYISYPLGTWTDVTATRPVNTPFENTTGRPIYIKVSARAVSSGTNNNRFDIEINGILLIGSYAYNSNADFQNSETIFPGDIYKIVTALAPSAYTNYKVLERT